VNTTCPAQFSENNSRLVPSPPGKSLAQHEVARRCRRIVKFAAWNVCDCTKSQASSVNEPDTIGPHVCFDAGLNF
jgi:hypothetical protein